MSFNYKEGEEYICRLCGEAKHTMGPRPDKLCDGCWELKTRIDMQPQLALQVLAPLLKNDLTESRLLEDFTTVFKVCGLQRIVDVASKVAEQEGLAFDSGTFVRSLAHDCVEIVQANLKVPTFSFVSNDAGKQTPGETLHVLTYELGKIVEYYHKAKRYGTTGYYCIENQQKEMSDFISMARFYCEQRGWDYSVLTLLGEQAYLERQEDLRQYGLEARDESDE